MKNVRFVGLDVHARSIAIAVAEPGGEVRSVGVIANDPGALQRVLKKLGQAEHLRVCYEAGPTGYAYGQLTKLGVHCEVVAPTLVPVKVGDRVKTDRRDAQKLARCYRAGDLTPVWVPDAAHEALRDLVRAREAAKRDPLRARQRVSPLQRRPLARMPAAAVNVGHHRERVLSRPPGFRWLRRERACAAICPSSRVFGVRRRLWTRDYSRLAFEAGSGRVSHGVAGSAVLE